MLNSATIWDGVRTLIEILLDRLSSRHNGPDVRGLTLASTAWAVENAKRGEEERPLLEPLGLHELRHSYVSLMHDAGFSLERIGDYVGHSSAYMTDAYRHLLEGHEAEAAERFEDYLARATEV
jgi:integrase